MIYYCIFALFVVYYISYTVLRNKHQLGYVFALIPVAIFIGIFWYLIQFKYYVALIFTLYGLGLFLVLVTSIILIIKKRIIAAIFSLIPLILSVSLFWWFASVNYFATETCDTSNGCMNETGMIMFLSNFFMVVAFFISSFMFILDKYIINKSSINYVK
ncbi:MAG: hypothetical protein CVV56_08435 [Tenericutes bacterium HGW-Tenericutes-1]|jgi:hypothetical protein|nr:MAG: hypothetical protein CVV56_08435 [Tenericutes bacterium HGW-Tenericutes-1]